MKTEPRWTIDALGEAVTAALTDGYDGPPNGRVRELPDRRTIRYYTTIGLLDRPAELRGRTALYGRRHLLQLVAIKKLQARGLSLAEVQQALVGQPDAELERLAVLEPGPGQPASSPSARTADFWRAVPAPLPPPTTPAPSPEPADELETLQGVRLARGVTLLLAKSHALGQDDLHALRAAAAPLLALLTRRKLIPSRTEEETR